MTSSPSRLSCRWLPILLICGFVFISLAADFWPAKKFYFYTDATGMRAFFRLEKLDPAGRYTMGNSVEPDRSLLYLIFLKLIHLFISDRLLCLRVLSVAAAAGGLVFFYQTASRLFRRPVAIIGLFFLVTDPTYLEGMRAFGYHSLTHLVALAVIFLVALSSRKRTNPGLIVLAAAASYLLFSLYALGRIAIILAVLWYLLSGPKEWKKLLIFLASLAAMLSLSDIAFRSGVGLSWLSKEGYHEWAFSQGHLNLRLLKDNVLRNFPVLVGYLTNLGRTPLSLDDHTSRLFNPFYTPFLLIGLAISLKRRKREDLFTLFLLALFAFGPLTSNGIPPRRIFFIIYPVAILAALGIRESYRFLAPVLTRRRLGKLSAPLACGLLILTGVIDIHTLVFEYAPPEVPASHQELKKIAEFIIENDNEYARILFPSDLSPLIRGNRYLSDRVSERLNDKLRTQPGNVLQPYVAEVIFTGHPLMALYYPPAPPPYSRSIEWARDNFPDSASTAQIPGTQIRYFIFSPPDSISPNLLAWKRPEILVSGGPPRVTSALFLCDFIDGEASTYGVEITPEEEGEAPWITMDFGSGNDCRPRVLLAEKAEIQHRPVPFIQSMRLMGSQDGREWEKLAQIENEHEPELDRWYQWAIPDAEAYRYYKLVFLKKDGSPAPAVALGELGLYESDRHYLAVFEPEKLTKN